MLVEWKFKATEGPRARKYYVLGYLGDEHISTCLHMYEKKIGGLSTPSQISLLIMRNQRSWITPVRVKFSQTHTLAQPRVQ